MFREYVLAVIRELDACLRVFDLIRAQEPGDPNTSGAVTWERDNPWKVDSVVLAHLPKAYGRLFVSFNVYLKEEGRSLRIFDGMTIDGTGNQNYFVIPAGFRKILWTPERFASYTARKTRAQLSWFDAFTSPEDCLRRLRTGETNGAGSGGKAYSKFESILRSLRESPTYCVT